MGTQPPKGAFKGEEECGIGVHDLAQHGEHGVQQLIKVHAAHRAGHDSQQPFELPIRCHELVEHLGALAACMLVAGEIPYHYQLVCSFIVLEPPRADFDREARSVPADVDGLVEHALLDVRDAWCPDERTRGGDPQRVEARPP